MAKTARAKVSEAAQSSPPPDYRTIALFSDGTGNSSAKLQKTNVWRLYEALDLGYPAAHQRKDGIDHSDNVQIAYYDDGVGTSAFKLLAMLGGVFGFGLARNICDIYKFLCRNYREGDPIFAFGFSRGAYTIRLLVGMIAQFGVVDYKNEEDLDFDARDLWAEYRRQLHTNNFLSDFVVCAVRAARRQSIRLKRAVFRQRPYAAGLSELRARNGQPPAPPFWREWWNHWFLTPNEREAVKLQAMGPEIAFVGVWDTVAAYGGPFIEITRALDEWVWPLTMSNYRLSPKVQRARHALAIDDKRDAFLPLLWDETDEADAKSNNPRLQQTWFAGVHSDVGGGYSDESLSFVSLHWMIEHAEQAGLRILPEFRRRIDQFRNVYGPLHNSRGGGGALYRYQPRYIAAWIAADEDKRAIPATRIFRDPTIDRGLYKDRGLLNHPIRMHKSVVERLLASTDGYGPNNVPRSFVIDDGIRGTETPKLLATVDPERSREIGDRIKLRRFWYFISIAIIVLMISKPLGGVLPSWLTMPFGGIGAGHGWVAVIESAVNALLPEFARHWTASFAADPLQFAMMVLALLATMALGMGHEKAMVDQSRSNWNFRLHGGLPPPGFSTINPLRWVVHKIARFVSKTEWVQDALAVTKWRIFPWAIGVVMLVAAAVLVYAAWTDTNPVLVVQRWWAFLVTKLCGQFAMLR